MTTRPEVLSSKDIHRRAACLDGVYAGEGVFFKDKFMRLAPT